MPEEDLLEIKFRLFDGSDIGPFRYSPASTVAMLKERIVTEWPKDKKGGPKSANDIKLINAGKILENNKTVGQCRTPFGELPKGFGALEPDCKIFLGWSKTQGIQAVDAEVGLFGFHRELIGSAYGGRYVAGGRSASD